MRRIVNFPNPNNYNEDPEPTIYPCLASQNQYIPVCSLTSGDLITNVKGEKDFLYTIPKRSHNNRNYTGRFLPFCDRIYRSDNEEGYIDVNTVLKNTYVSSNSRIAYLGLNKDEYHPLLLLCAKKEFLYSISKDNPDNSQFCIVISNDFLYNPEHYKLYRNVKKNLLDEISPVIDIIFTNDIRKLCFNSPKLTLPKGLKNMHQVFEYYNEINLTLKEELKQVIV